MTRFFNTDTSRSLEQLADEIGADIHATNDIDPKDIDIAGVAPLDLAQRGDLSFLDNKKYKSQLQNTRASAVILGNSALDHVPDGVVALTHAEPYRAYAKAAQLIYPDSVSYVGHYDPDYQTISDQAHIHESVILEAHCRIDGGVQIGKGCQIGEGTYIAGNAVIGQGVTIGRGCYIGPNVSILCAHIGDRVFIHSGCAIGQDGFGFAMGAGGHVKVPQIGRVIIQDDVEIGANSTVDRGANRDTIIGEGTKIDNLVQIGHNAVIGRHCVLVSYVGIAGSAVLGDYVVMGAKSGVAGHLNIGHNVQIAGGTHMIADAADHTKWAGSPARPFADFARSLAALRKLGRRKN